MRVLGRHWVIKYSKFRLRVSQPLEKDALVFWGACWIAKYWRKPRLWKKDVEWEVAASVCGNSDRRAFDLNFRGPCWLGSVGVMLRFHKLTRGSSTPPPILIWTVKLLQVNWNHFYTGAEKKKKDGWTPRAVLWPFFSRTWGLQEGKAGERTGEMGTTTCQNQVCPILYRHHFSVAKCYQILPVSGLYTRDLHTHPCFPTEP